MKDVVEPAQLTVWVAPDSTQGTPAQVTIVQQLTQLLVQDPY